MEKNTQKRMVHCEKGVIPYLLTRKPVKNINLRIKPDGQILVSANNTVPIEFIDSFIENIGSDDDGNL